RRFNHHAVGGGHHRRSDRRAVVDTVVWAEVVEERMEAALREAGGDAAELQRGFEELLAERRAGARVVAGESVRRVVAERFVRQVVMREARGEDRAVSDEIAAGVALLHHHAERVALAQREEVDVPLEDVDELLHELRTLAGAAERFVERAVDRGRDARLDLALLGGAWRDV